MLRAAIVGLGGWGQRLVSSVQGKSDRINFVRGVTRTVAKVREFSEATGIPVSDDFQSLLSDPDIEAVVLATPHSQHVEQVVAAARAGKHVFVEKPLALTVAGVHEAFDVCEKHGVVLAVGQNRRFLPATRKIRELIDTGQLGRILHVEGNHSGPSGWRHAQSSWRSSGEESPWGGMTGKGLHTSDLMIHFVGPITEIDARSDRQVLTIDLDDTTVMLLRFGCGARGYLASLAATADTWRMQIFGSKGWVEMRGLNKLILARNNEAEEVLEFDPVDIEREELEAFAQCVRGGTPFVVSREEAANNIALLEGIGRSIEAGGTVSLTNGKPGS